MFESLVASIINKFLGEYVDNLERKQLNIAIWNGDVRLKNLKLRKDALDKFNLPIEVKQGYLSELILTIPWQNLKSKPVKIVINGLYVLACSKAETTYDPVAEEARLQKLKQEKLEAYEMLSMNSMPSGKEGGQKSEEEQKRNDSFISSLTTKVIDNIQLTIKNIHIRYEDNLSNPAVPFSAGITLSNLSAVSSNENFIEAFITDSSSKVFKLVMLNSLAIYWETHSQSIYTESIEELISSFSKKISDSENPTGGDETRQYLLKPVSGSCHLTLNKRFSSMSLNEPKTLADVNFEEISFNLDDQQYETLQGLIDFFTLLNRSYEYRTWRPPKGVSPKSDPKSWWKFAITCVKEKIHAQNYVWSWDHFKGRRDDRNRYVELYTKKKTSAVLPDKDRVDFETLEKKLSYFDIRMYRVIADARIRKTKELKRLAENQKKKEAAAAKKDGPAEQATWVGWWMGSSSANAKDTDTVPEGTSVEEFDLKAFYDTIGFDDKGTIAQIDLPKEAELLRVNFCLNKGSFSLIRHQHSDKSNLLECTFSNVSSQFINRPDSFVVKAGLNDVLLSDGSTPDTLFPYLVKGNSSKVFSLESDALPADGNGSLSKLLELEIEKNPIGLNKKMDWAVRMNMRPLQIVYNHKAVNAVRDFFSLKSQFNDETIEAIANEAQKRLQSIQKITRAGLLFALEERKLVDINMSLEAPLIILPKDCSNSESMMFLADLGSIKILSELVDGTSEFKSASSVAGDLSNQELSDLSYDRFKINLQSLMLYHSSSIGKFQQAMKKDDSISSEMKFIEKIDCNLYLEKSIISGVVLAGRPEFRITGEIPNVQMNFSDLRYRNMMELLDTYLPSAKPDVSELNISKADLEKNARDRSSKAFSLFNRNSIFNPDADEDFGKLNQDSKESDDAQTEASGEFFDANEEINDSPRSLTAAPLDAQSIEIILRIGQMYALTFKETEAGERQIICGIGAESFEMNVGRFTYDMKVNLGVGNFFIKDEITYTSFETGDVILPDVYLFKSNPDVGSDSKFLQVEYLKVDPAFPNFLTIYQGIGQIISIKLSAIESILRNNSLVVFQQFIASTFSSPSKDQNPVVEEEKEEKAPSTPIDDTSSQMKISFFLKSVSVTLLNGNSAFGNILLQEGSLNLHLKNPLMHVEGTLKQFTITDLKQEIPFCRIEGGNVADFSYETFHPTHDFDSYLKFQSGSLVITYLPDFAIQAFSFLRSIGNATPERKEPVAMPQKKEIKPVEEESGKRLKLDVRVSTPVVEIARGPGGSSGVGKIIAHLGSLKLTNEFILIPGFQVETRMLLKLSAISLFSELDLVSPQSNVIEPLDITFKIQMIQDFAARKIPNIIIDGEMSKMKSLMIESQYDLLMQCVNFFTRTIGGVFQSPEDSKDLKSVTEITDGVSKDQNEEIDCLGQIPERQCKLDMVLVFKGIDLSIANENSGESIVKSLKPLCQFSLNETTFKYSQFSDESSEMECKIHSFTIRDVRTDINRIYRDMLPPLTHDEGQLHIHFAKTEVGSQLLKVTLDSPEVILIIDLIFAVLDFFDSSSRPSQVVVAQTHSPVIESKNNPKNDDARPQEPQVMETSFFFVLNVIDANVMILDNPCISSSEAVSLRFNKLTISHQGNSSINLDGLGGFFCNMDKREMSALRFLDDLDLSLTIERSCNYWLRVKPIVFRISYQDTLFLLSIADTISKHRRSSDNSAVNVNLTENDPSAVIDVSATLEESLQRSMLNKSNPSSPTSSISRISKCFSLDIEDFRFLLIDDVSDCHLPFMDLQLGKIATDVQDFDSLVNFACDLKPSISYYNVRNSHWEPFFEPWKCNLRLTKSIELGYVIDFSSKSEALLNLSHNFLDYVTSVKEIISKSSKNRKVSASRDISAPYVIFNHTGYSLMLWDDSYSPMGGKGDKDLVEVKSGSKVSWSFSSWKNVRDAADVASSHGVFGNMDKIALQITGGTTPWETVRSVPIDSEGLKIYPLRPRTDVSHKIVVEVSLVRNIKHVVIRSSVGLKNCTAFPLEFILVDKKGQQMCDAPIVVDSFGVGSFPLDLGYYHFAKVRPAGNLGYQWCKQRINWREVIENDDIYDVECSGESKSMVSFYYRLEVKCDKQNTKINNYPFLDFVFYPPLELENALPFDMLYKLSTRGSKVEFSGLLRKGQSQAVHNTNPDESVALSFSLVGTDISSDFVLIQASKDSYNEDTVQCVDKDGNRLILSVGYEPIGGMSNAARVIVFCPYVLINRSSLPLIFCSSSWATTNTIIAGQREIFNKWEQAGKPKSFEFNKPILFNYLDFEVLSASARVKLIGSNEWSKALGSFNDGASNEVELTYGDNRYYYLTMNVIRGPGRYFRSKFVEFLPHIVLKNCLDLDIDVKQVGQSDNHILTIPSKEKKPFYDMPEASATNFLIQIKRKGVDNEWSSLFRFNSVGRYYLKVTNPKDFSHSDLVQVDVVVEHRCLYVLFSSHQGVWPFTIENKTSKELSFAQTDTDCIYSLKPGESCKYTWDRLDLEKKSLSLLLGVKRSEINITEIGSSSPIVYTHPDTGERLAVVVNVFAGAYTFKVEVKEFDEIHSLYRLRRKRSAHSSSDNILADSVRNSSSSSVGGHAANNGSEDFDIKRVTVKQNFFINVNLAGIGVSLIDKELKEILFLSAKELSFKYWDTEIETNLNFRIRWLQMDNQMFACQQPVTLYPTVVPNLSKLQKIRESANAQASSSSSSSKNKQQPEFPPFFETSLFKLKDTVHGVEYFKYFGLLLQEASVDVDEPLIRALVKLMKIDVEKPIESNESLDFGIPDVSSEEAMGMPFYFEIFHLNPMLVNFSFTKPEFEKKKKAHKSNPLFVVIDSLLATFGNIHDAPILLPAIINQNWIVNQSFLVKAIMEKYKDQIFSQIYKLVGSADFLGNPIAIYGNLVSGINDVFYEPIQGVIKRDPHELGIGLAKGGLVLVSKTFYTFADAMSRFSGSLGKGLSVMTMDSKFQQKRNVDRTRNRPKHFISGVYSGSKSFAAGLASGIVGVVEKPIEGAMKEGVFGFIKGAGKGVVGFFTKPIVGTIDMVSNVSEGVKGSSSDAGNELERIRLPRLIPLDRVLRPYSETDAIGQFTLFDLDEGAFSKDFYIGHVEVKSESHMICIVSNNRIVAAHNRRHHSLWEIHFRDFKTIKASYEGVTMFLVDGDRKFIPIADYETSNYFCSLVNEGIGIYNAEVRPID